MFIKLSDHISMASEMVQIYLNSPASIPPEGTVANLDNPTKHNAGSLALLVLCLLLTMVVGVGRAYSRIFVVKNLRVEDCTLAARIPQRRYQDMFANRAHARQ